MTLNEMMDYEEEIVSIYDVAPILGCDPQKLRDALDIDDELPLDRRKFLFPHCKIGNRRKIGRIGFIRWISGDINPVTAVWKMKQEMNANGTV